MASMTIFPANNEFFRKRKRVHRACEACKKRRKRCTHTFDDDEGGGSPTESGQPGRNPPEFTSASTTATSSSTTTTSSATINAITSTTTSPSGHYPPPPPPSSITARLLLSHHNRHHHHQQQLADTRTLPPLPTHPPFSRHVSSPIMPSHAAHAAQQRDNGEASTAPSFLGYLNPEQVLLEPVRPLNERGQSTASPVTPVDPWRASPQDVKHSSADYGPLNSRPDDRRPQMAHLTQETADQTSRRAVVIEDARRGFLNAVQAWILPPSDHRQALVNIYGHYVQPLLPIVDEDIFSKWYADNRAPVMLVQAICLVACKHADAARHLILGDEDCLLPPREFSQRLYNAIIAGIEAKLEKNRIVLIQVLALISLHSEGEDGAEQASMHLAQAIHHAHTYALQFDYQWKNRHCESHGNLEDLFRCLWSLDKINACTSGRPLIMHDRDNTLTMVPTDPEKRSSPFGVWLQISEMLDKVIDFYRPGRPAEETGWESEDFLGFEEMVGEGGHKLPGPIQSLLSLYHHTMCMASHRSLSINAPVKSTPSYVRQSLSATRVIGMLSEEPPESLPPLPIVYYSLSYAMSVVYRHFRHRRLDVHQRRAHGELKSCADLLNRLRSAWWSAGRMADLGYAVLNNADRNTRSANTPAATAEQAQLLDNQRRQSVAPQSQSGHQWPHPALDNSIDPRLQGGEAVPPTPSILNNLPTPGQHPTSSERAQLLDLDFGDPSDMDWVSFDNAINNFGQFLGGAGPEPSHQLYRNVNDTPLGGLFYPMGEGRIVPDDPQNYG